MGFAVSRFRTGDLYDHVKVLLDLDQSINMLPWQSGLICSLKIVKVASSNSAHHELHRGLMNLKEEGKNLFELRSLCMHTVRKGGVTPTVGRRKQAWGYAS